MNPRRQPLSVLEACSVEAGSLGPDLKPQPERDAQGRNLPSPSFPVGSAEHRAQSWEDLSGAAGECKSLVASEGAPGSQPPDAPPARASRLSGLRGLFASMDLSGLRRAREAAAKREADVLDASPKRPVHGRIYTPFPDEETRKAAASALLTETAAAREFPSRKDPAGKPPKDSAQADPASARWDRRDPYDAVDILPSWRGQYKKKK